MLSPVQKELSGKNVLVVGLGLQGGGVALVKFLHKYGANVTVTDVKTEQELQSSLRQLADLPIRYVLGKHEYHDFLKADIIFKGPSVRWDLPELVAAHERGIPIEMETSFFVAHSPAKIVGVTGTRGKSTTTFMIYHCLKRCGYTVFLGGNIPQAPAITLLDTVTSQDIIVLELSSWQLAGFHRRRISPQIAVFTNFYPDHLNYYQSMNDYLYDKKAIYLYQGDNDYLIAHKSLQSMLVVDTPRSHVRYFTADDFPTQLRYLRGAHNQENAAAALAVVELMGCDSDGAKRCIDQYEGLPHRQQVVGELHGISFINDTTSTTPVATVKSLETFVDKPVVLLFGGNSKRLPTDDLIQALGKADFIILLKGTMTDELLPTLREKYSDKTSPIYDNLEVAVHEAYEKAKLLGNAYVILSPGATSFAMFQNEFQRGEEFNEIVKRLT